MLRGFLILCVVVPFCCYGFDDAPKCYYESSKHFFSDDSVARSFHLYQVPQGQWNLMIKVLGQDTKEIQRILKKRARDLKPNPLEYPFDAERAEKLRKETLFLIFFHVLNEYTRARSSDIEAMFDYIYEAHDPPFQDCLKEE